MFNDEFIKIKNKNFDIGYNLVEDIEYPCNLQQSHENIPVLPKRKVIIKVSQIKCTFEKKISFTVQIKLIQ